MPEWLTRKIGPLPAWGYGAIAAGLFVVLRLRKASSSSSGTTPGSANYTATAPDIPTASVTEPGGFSYNGPLGGLSQLIPTGAMSATNGGTSNGVYSPPTGESRIGGGYGYGSNPQLVTSPTGTQFAQVPAGAATGGTQYYYQPEPGVFSKINPAKPPGGPATPWFQALTGSA